jgi:ABC-type uncharacterized transport system substrate-binding protein
MPMIGFLNAASPDTVADRLRAFRQGLKDTGYVEGENVTISYRWAENQINRLPELAAELVRRPVAVIATTQGIATALAAKAATTTIPIVFGVGDDPVKLGLVASLARPGGNATGINFFSVELAAKRVEILRELVPGAVRMTVLVNPTNSNAETTVRDVQSAARAIGLQIQVFNASTSREINVAFATFMRERPDARCAICPLCPESEVGHQAANLSLRALADITRSTLASRVAKIGLSAAPIRPQSCPIVELDSEVIELSRLLRSADQSDDPGPCHRWCRRL